MPDLDKTTITLDVLDATDKAYDRGFAAGVQAARDKAGKVLVEYLGERGPVPETRDQWGPHCAGCYDDEYRIDGYCSMECREYSYLSNALLAALSSLSEKGASDDV